MKTEHKGFKVTGMTGNMSAEIADDGDYTHIKIIGFGEEKSLDLEGFQSLIDDLQTVRELARSVDQVNGTNRDFPE